MQIQVAAQSLAEKLKLIVQFIQKETALDALANVKLETEADGMLRMTGSDYEIEATCRLGCVVAAPGAVALSAQLLPQIIASLKGETVTITVDEQWQATIQSGRSRFRLAGMNPERFPLLPPTADKAPLLLPQSLLKDMFEKTVHAVSRSDSRPALTGGCLTLKGSLLRLDATDCYRLMIYPVEFEGDLGRQARVIIPLRLMRELPDFLSADEDEEVEVRVDAAQIEFVTPAYTLKGRLIAGEFPRTDKVVEPVNDYTNYSVLNRQALIAALKRVAIIAREDLHRINGRTEGTGVLLTAASQGRGESEAKVEPVMQAGSLDAWYRADQLLEMLHAFDGENVMIRFNEPQQPIQLLSEAQTYFGIIQPLSPPGH